MGRDLRTAGIEDGESPFARVLKIALALLPIALVFWGYDFLSNFDERWPDGQAKGAPYEDEGVLYDFDEASQTAQFRTYEADDGQCVQLSGAAVGQRAALARGKGSPPAYDMRVSFQRRFGRSRCSSDSLPLASFAELTDIKTGIAITCGPDDFINRRRHCP